MNLETLSLVLILSAVPAAGAQAPECSPGAGAETCHVAHSRQLGGHTFLYPILQQSALITTQFGLHEGVAFFDVPDLPVITLGLRDVSLKGFQQTLELELGLTDWLGLEGFARGTLVMGATPTELLLGGAQRSLVGQAGGVARLLRSEKTGTQLSFRAHGSYQDGAEININPLLNGLVTSPVQTVGAVLDGNLRELIVVPTSEMSVRGGLYLAQAFSALFSLQASAAMEYGWLTRKPFSGMLDTRVTQKGDALRVLLAFALAADFGPKGVPVGVMGEYQLIAGRDHEENRADRSLGASTVALGVYYTGRPHLQLGVGLATTLHAEPLRGVGTLGEELLSGDPTLDYGQLVLRYIW